MRAGIELWRLRYSIFHLGCLFLLAEYDYHQCGIYISNIRSQQLIHNSCRLGYETKNV
jgi:hypothetical protein